MKPDPGMTISCVGHVAALLGCLVAMSAQPMEAPPVETLPVQFISEQDFTKLTQGVKNAPQLKIDEPKPLADKVDTPKPVDQLAAKVANKPEITTDSSPSRNPKPIPSPIPSRRTSPTNRSRRNTSRSASPTDRKDAAEEDHPKFDADQVAELAEQRHPRRDIMPNGSTTPPISAPATGARYLLEHR